MKEQSNGQPDHLVVVPGRFYTVREVAEILGLHADTVYRIPESWLRRTRIGPRGGRTKIRGADLLQYLGLTG